MTSPEIDTAIAQACGWKHVQGFRWQNPNGLSFYEWDIPNYSNDLNAMHLAEKTLSNANMYRMTYHIKALVRGDGEFYFHATARQRAEAFLRTVGLWRATIEESSAV